jgi:hypothetical protein
MAAGVVTTSTKVKTELNMLAHFKSLQIEHLLL